MVRKNLQIEKSIRSLLVVFALWAAVTHAKGQEPTRELVLAAARGDAAAIPLLVAAGANPNARFNPDTLQFSWAAEPPPSYYSVVSISTMCGCAAATQALILAGAVPSEDDFFYSVWFNQLDIASIVLQGLAPGSEDRAFIPMLTIRMPSEVSQTVRRVYLHKLLTGHASNDLDSLSLDVLFSTAHARNPDDPVFALLSRLLAAGYDIEAQSHGYPEGTARELSSRNGDVLLARELAKRGAARPASWTEEREKEIQLVGAATVGNLAGVQLLLGEKVSPNSTDTDGRHALAQALERARLEVAKQILEAGADPNLASNGEAAPLASASRLDHVPLVELLLDRGAVADRLDGQGEFALKAAAREGAMKTVELLLARGASPQFTDASGNTALHGIFKVDDSRRTRPIRATHLEAIRALAAAGLPLQSVNNQGESVIASNLHHWPERNLLDTFLAVGGRVTNDDIRTAIGHRDPTLLRALLPYAEDDRQPADVLQLAGRHIEEIPGLAEALLDFGVELPGDDGARLGLLEGAAGSPSEVVLGLLLVQGLSLSVDPQNKALERALVRGRPKNVALLANKGLDLVRQDSLGYTALHRVVVNDARGDDSSKLGAAQQEAIAALFDAGFPIDATDRDGLTVLDQAARKSSTLAAVSAAIALAGSATKGIHAAIRADDLEEVRRLASAVEQLEAKDSLGRTPLSFALQIGNWAAARILLRAGASIAVTPRTGWQPADIDFAGETAIASAFAVRLLVDTLIDIPSDRSRPALEGRRASYQSRSTPIENFTWKLDCSAPTVVTCGDGFSMAGDQTAVFDLIHSVRSDNGQKTSFGMIQRSFGSIDVGGFGDVTFEITGKLEIAGCSFSFEDPACSPGIRILNPNTPGGILLETGAGFEEQPPATFRYSQLNGAIGVLAPGQEIVLDRSVGPITLEMDRVEARVFALWVEIERLAGEEIEPLPDEPSTRNRMDLYSRILRSRQLWKDEPTSDAERAANKTLATAIAALSNESYLSSYPAVVLELLRQQARVVAKLDLQVRRIQKVVMAQATYTPQQIDVLIAQIDAALANTETGDKAILHQIRSELVVLRASAEATGVAINDLKNRLFTDADLFIELYQALVLEYRQYVPSSELGTALTQEERTAVRDRVSSYEVVVPDHAADGSGEVLREAFGLPRPTL